jgi:hypothetical protein
MTSRVRRTVGTAHQPIERAINEIEPGTGAPVTERPRVEMFQAQWFAQQGFLSRK